ncbi:hypothetical protein [Bradyrhizobium lablabi]|uniref:hypothetical protein n=1 Tax=Bradyrhizobium lablabi TaxID=722472 RepID=UPI001BA590E3|nr:hypothetical protein [Bradyrhizobium lablabi]MBR0693670.1 hypothetical protein [Bradyrhizobium lablabi]
MLLLLLNQSPVVVSPPPPDTTTPPRAAPATRVASKLYPRTIDVRRLKTVAGTSDTLGLTGYSGAEASTGSSPEGETVLFTGIPASIQARATGRKKDSSLPQDVVYAPTWHIWVPRGALAKDAVRDRDVIVDDNGYRYEVAQNYWNLLGYKLVCIRLEA